jgi:uncharacterized DUF497 family protein
VVIELDPAKDASNQIKHGVSLARFADLDLTRAFVTPTERNQEAREVVIGPIDDVLHVGVITRRGTTIRVISLRRANSRERKRHAQAIAR